MWIFLNNAFYSIVDPSNGESNKLLVRARFAGDINLNFPNAVEIFTPNRDYAYRAEIDRAEVITVITNRIDNINYNNFKDTVEEDWRHDAYLNVWSVMHDEQLNRKGLNSKR